jgi:hydrogenase expression/formation protein HypE
MRDPTRGGLVTVAHEIARASALQIRLQQDRIPIRDEVQSVCDMLGYDPLFLACEGRVVAIVSPDQADTALQSWRALPGGEQAALIGECTSGDPLVTLRTKLGGERIIEELEDDPLPRIC